MNTHPYHKRFLPTSPLASLALIVLAFGWSAANADTAPALLDDFSDPERNSYGHVRLLINDKDLGGQSQASQTCVDGVLSVEGELAPGRGAPAFVSLVSLLSSDGQARDLSQYEGVRLRANVLKGILLVQVGSAEIDNFDYHSSQPIAGKRGTFQEIKIPFADLRRTYSEQIPLDRSTIISVNLVSFGMAKAAFAYQVEEIGFY